MRFRQRWTGKRPERKAIMLTDQELLALREMVEAEIFPLRTEIETLKMAPAEMGQTGSGLSLDEVTNQVTTFMERHSGDATHHGPGLCTQAQCGACRDSRTLVFRQTKELVDATFAKAAEAYGLADEYNALIDGVERYRTENPEADMVQFDVETLRTVADPTA
jgi:hypothetical protein|tara:strand:- start:358 stop:846 length:489 start_codon:yes stop_codon:yes gene_type:complete